MFPMPWASRFVPQPVSRMPEPSQRQRPNEVAFVNPDKPLDLSTTSEEKAAGASCRSQNQAACPIRESRTSCNGDGPSSQNQPLDLSITSSCSGRYRTADLSGAKPYPFQTTNPAAAVAAAAAAAAAAAVAAAAATAADALAGDRHAAAYRRDQPGLNARYDQVRHGDKAEGLWQTSVAWCGPTASSKEAADERHLQASHRYRTAAAPDHDRQAFIPRNDSTPPERYDQLPRHDGASRLRVVLSASDLHTNRGVPSSRSDSVLSPTYPSYGSNHIWHTNTFAPSTRPTFGNPLATEQLSRPCLQPPNMSLVSSRQVMTNIEPHQRHQPRALNASYGNAPFVKSAMEAAAPGLPARMWLNESPKNNVPSPMLPHSRLTNQDDPKKSVLPQATAFSEHHSIATFPHSMTRAVPNNSNDPYPGDQVAFHPCSKLRSTKRKAVQGDLKKSSWPFSEYSSQHAKRLKEQSMEYGELGNFTVDSGGSGKMSLARYMEAAATKVFQRENVDPPTDLSALLLLQWPQGDQQGMVEGSMPAQPMRSENLMGVLHQAVERGLRQCTSPPAKSEPCTSPLTGQGQGHVLHSLSGSSTTLVSTDPLKGLLKVEPTSSPPPALIGADKDRSIREIGSRCQQQSLDEQIPSVILASKLQGDSSSQSEQSGSISESLPATTAKALDLKLSNEEGAIYEMDKLDVPADVNQISSVPSRLGCGVLSKSLLSRRLVVRLRPVVDTAKQTRPAQTDGNGSCSQVAWCGNKPANLDLATPTTHPDERLRDDGEGSGPKKNLSPCSAPKAAQCQPTLLAAATNAKPGDAGAGKCRASCVTCGRSEIDMQACFGSVCEETGTSEKWASMTNSEGRLVLVKVKYCCTHRLHDGQATTATVVVQESEDQVDEAENH